MKLHAIVFCVALALVGQSARGENAPVAIVASTEELAIPPIEFESAPVACGSPLTLMQWSYGDGDAEEFDGAYPGAMETDRPYFTKSASVVGIRAWQLETGYTYAENGRQVYHTFPEAILRVGALAEWFEFRVGWTWLDHDRKGNVRDQTGASDPYVGIKIALTPQEEMLPETAILIDTNLPLDSLDRNEMNPGVDFIYRWELSDKLSMGGSTEFRRISLNRHDSAIEFVQSWIFEWAVTDLLTGYAEWAMFSLDTPPSTDTQQYIAFSMCSLTTFNWTCRRDTGSMSWPWISSPESASQFAADRHLRRP